MSPRNQKSPRPGHTSIAGEEILWSKLKSGRNIGSRFRRHRAFGVFVLGFYCAEHKLAIEVDERQLRSPAEREFDRRREEYAALYGIAILRFTESEIRSNLDSVLTTIEQAVKNRFSYLPAAQWQGAAADSPEMEYDR